MYDFLNYNNTFIFKASTISRITIIILLSLAQTAGKRRVFRRVYVSRTSDRSLSLHGISNGRGVRPSLGVSRSAPRAVSVAAGTVSRIPPKPAVQPFRRGETGLHSGIYWRSDGEMMDRDSVWKSERASDGVSENNNQRAAGARATHFGYAAPERCTHPRRRWRQRRSGYII